MTKKRNGFLRFCCSLLPGAGEMYMGFMKMGLSLMSMFFGIIVAASIFELGPLAVLAVIAWFYSFFHVHNLAGLSDEEFYAVEDEYLFHLSGEGEKDKSFVKRYRTIIAVVLILLGIMLIWNSFYWMIANLIPDETVWVLQEISYRLPRLLAGIAIIAAGIYLVHGKKKSLEEEETKEA